MRLRIRIVCLLVLVLASACDRSARRRVVVLGIDGLDPVAIELLVGEGKLPNFARLRRGGAFGKLRSSRPMLSPILWTTIVTGRTPIDHGIGHFVAVDERGNSLPVTSAMRRVRALWNIASDAGRTVGVVGWWATWPAEAVRGTIVSDHAGYHFLFEEALRGTRSRDGVVHPAAETESLLTLMRRPDDVRPADLVGFVDVPAEEFTRPFDFKDDLGHFRWAWATATGYRQIGLELLRRQRPDLLMVYIEGVDSTSHLFGHLFRAGGLAGELAEQQKRYGGTVEAMYRFADEIVGAYREAIDTDTTLVVLSDHGFQLGTLHDDPSKSRDMRRVSERYHREEGVLYLYGNGIVPGVAVKDAELLDVTPTLLTLLGLPAARDMPGRVLDEALRVVPLPRIQTHETGTVQAAAPRGGDAAVDPAIVERLRALGYLGAQSPQGDRNFANMLFAEGRHAEAERAYRQLLEKEPNDAVLHSSLAGALGAQGRYDEAEAEIARALALDPLIPEPYQNRGVIAERRGRRDEAIGAYRSALRYQPEYQPAREALARLGIPADEASTTAERRQARALADRAGNAARRGDYGEADRLLDEAQRVDPGFILLHHYRANVAYLRGDRDAAIAALERALAPEPDNALFRENLERLKKSGAR